MTKQKPEWYAMLYKSTNQEPVKRQIRSILSMSKCTRARLQVFWGTAAKCFPYFSCYRFISC